MSTIKEDRIGKSYDFLLEKEKSKKAFTVAELAKNTGWSEATIRTYLSKKWDTILERKGQSLLVKNISKYNKSEYSNLMSQVNKNSQDPFKPELDEEVEALLIKARESALLGLDIYNRPATLFKSEGFIVIMIIAWTSLFHAIFHRKGIKYNYVDDNNNDKYVDGELKAWELSKCTKEYYQDDNNSIRKNIEFMIGLRNKIEHRFAPKIDNHVNGECQALLLNFDELLVEEFGNYYALKDSLVFPLQTTNLRNIERIDTVKKFQGKHYNEIKEYIDSYRDSINDDVYNDPRYSFRVYLVPKSGNHKSSSDISMEFVKYDANKTEDIEAQKHLITLIKEKLVKTGDPEGLKAKKVANKVQEKLGKKFSVHNHTQAWKYYKIREAVFVKGHFNDYCYSDEVHQDYVYRPAWVDFLLRKLSSDEEYEKVTTHKVI